MHTVPESLSAIWKREIRMNIRKADWEDMPGILKYDNHIHHDRIGECIQNQRIYVLGDEAEVVGVLRYSLFWQSIPFLDLLYIDGNYRGKGFGTRMMAYWESDMRKMGYKYGMLSTQEDETGKFFYEKMGYRRIGAFLPPDQSADEIMYLKELVKDAEIKTL